MMRCYPDFGTDGWHLEWGWTWGAFGLILCGTWGHSVVLRIGWAYVMLWKWP